MVLTFVFVALFYLGYAPALFDALPNLFAVDVDLSHSRTVTSAEFLGFVAVAIVLGDLKSDRVLGRWDYIAIAGYPGRFPLSVTCYSRDCDDRVGPVVCGAKR